MIKRFAYSGFILLWSASSAMAQAVPFVPSDVPQHTVVSGTQNSEAYGGAMAALGDINNDGILEFAVGAPGYSDAGGASRGKVEVRNANGGLVFTALGIFGGAGLGASISLLDDINNDQVKDILVGTYGGGHAQILSGQNGSVLRQINGATYGVAPSAYFGWAVSNVGDVDLDQISDYAISAIYAGPFLNGNVFVFSGATGNQVPGSPFVGTAAVATVGHSLGKLGDIDGDGRADFLVGTPSSTTGHAYILSGLNLSILRTHTGTPSPHFSFQYGNCVASMGDLNNDGFPEYAVTEPDLNKVYLYSGINGALLKTFTNEPSQITGSAFGQQVAAAGDVDRDGVGDILISQQRYVHPTLTNAGAIYVFSGRTHQILDLVVVGPQSQFGMFHGLISLGDINRDGYIDIAFGSPDATNFNVQPNVPNAGQVYVQRLVGAVSYGDNVNRGLKFIFLPGRVGPGASRLGYFLVAGGTPFNYVYVGASTAVSPLSPTDPILIDLFNFPLIQGVPFGVTTFDANGNLLIPLLPFYRYRILEPRKTAYFQAAEFFAAPPPGYTTSKGLMFTVPW